MNLRQIDTQYPIEGLSRVEPEGIGLFGPVPGARNRCLWCLDMLLKLVENVFDLSVTLPHFFLITIVELAVPPGEVQKHVQRGSCLRGPR